MPSQASADADGVIVKFRPGTTVAQIASLAQQVGAGQVTDRIRGTDAVVLGTSQPAKLTDWCRDIYARNRGTSAEVAA